MRLRPYKPSDAEYLFSWLPTDKKDFIKWCACGFKFPPEKSEFEQYYHKFDDNNISWLMTALDNVGIPVGHFMMCNADYEKQSIHLGFIIVDPQIRGKGYGLQMLKLAISYAFDILGMDRVTLKVFENNLPAYKCYLSAGFKNEGISDKIFLCDREVWNAFDMAAYKYNI